MTPQNYSHAVVVGGSIAGLLAAKVLSNFFSKVTVIDKDTFPESVSARNAVPQGRHLHVLLNRGYKILNDFFPGFWQDMQERGSVEFDMCDDFRWHQWGTIKKRVPSGLDSMFQSRPFLEHYLRAETLKTSNINFRSGKFLRLVIDKSKNTVKGIDIESDHKINHMDCDWTVLTPGRLAPLPSWLAEVGVGSIPTSEINNRIGYASAWVKIPKDVASDWKAIAVVPEAPSDKRGGVIVPVEDDCHIVTLFGYVGDHPENRKDEFLKFSASLHNKSIFKILEQSEFIGNIELYKFPKSYWRHFESCNNFPGNLSILGDAAASFNPIYGQGMTVAAIGAEVLNEFLLSDSKNSLKFQKDLAKQIKVPWDMTRDVDRRYPEVGMSINWLEKFLVNYKLKLDKMCIVDENIALNFSRVVNLVQTPNSLVKPSILFRVMSSRNPVP